MINLVGLIAVVAQKCAMKVGLAMIRTDAKTKNKNKKKTKTKTKIKTKTKTEIKTKTKNKTIMGSFVVVAQKCAMKGVSQQHVILFQDTLNNSIEVIGCSRDVLSTTH